jgi:hypothetical protein
MSKAAFVWTKKELAWTLVILGGLAALEWLWRGGINASVDDFLWSPLFRFLSSLFGEGPAMIIIMTLLAGLVSAVIFVLWKDFAALLRYFKKNNGGTKT